MTENTPEKWYQTRAAIVVLLLFVPPLGMILLWNRKTSTGKKIIGTFGGLFGCLMWIGIIAPKPPAGQADSSGATQTAAAEVPSNEAELAAALAQDVKTLDAYQSQPISSPSDAETAVGEWLAIEVKAQKAAASTDANLKKLGADAMAALQRAQKREFPKMRKHLAEHLAKARWEEDVEVSAGGQRNTQLIYVCHTYVLNANKKADYQEVANVAALLRFKEVHFSAYEGDENGSYWETGAPDDGAPLQQ